MEDTLERLINERADLNSRIDDLQRAKRDTEYAILEEVMYRRMFDCIKVNYANILRRIDPRAIVPEEFK